MESHTGTPLCESNGLPPMDMNYRPNMMVPQLSDRHKVFLDISDAGHMLIGCGDLCGRIWSSSFHYLKEASTSVCNESAKTVPEVDTVVSCGKIIESGKKLVLGDDVGKIAILSIEEAEANEFNFFTEVTAHDHDCSVLSLALSPDRQKLVSGGADMCIKVWDITDSLSTLFTYRPAHSNLVTHVEFLPKNNDIFVSCSYDGTTSFWDTRKTTKPASVFKSSYLKEEGEEGLQTGCWLKNNDNVLAVGSNFGNIYLLDVRMEKRILEVECFERPLHKIVCNSEDIVAACGVTPEVKAFQVSSENLKPIYSNHDHEDYVQGLAWHPITSKLYSCGFDSKIVCHDINQR